MITRSQAIWVHYQAWDVNNAVGKTGDVANHTLQIVLDGNISAASNSPQEIGGGMYRVSLTAAEVNGLSITLGGVSATSNIYILPVHMVTTDNTRGVEFNMQYTGWDTSANTPETGDDGNHTLSIATGNTTAAATNTPTEISAALIPGVYNLLLTTDETAEPIDSIYGTSSTSDVVIVPTMIPTGRKYSVVTDSNDPLEHRIMAVVATRLATITIAEGYKTNAGNNVKPWFEFGEDNSNYPAIYYEDIDDEEEQATVGKVDHVLTVTLHLLADRENDATEATALKQIREIIADIKQMVGTDTTWSDLAETTQNIDARIEMEQMENKQWASTISLFINFKTDRFNAYS